MPAFTSHVVHSASLEPFSPLRPPQLSFTNRGWEEREKKCVFNWFEGDQVPPSVTSITDSSKNIGGDGEEDLAQQIERDEKNDFMQDSSDDDSSENDYDSDTIDNE
ncbi:hypothetical protein JTB14_000585 [Gonioctena quinquepunctata]|nr:hypothetical protein JTB14_000585 [Gonioctena quinquepunctata]